MRVNTTAFTLVLLLPQVAAANSRQAVDQQAAEEQPDAELLEFIAEFEPLDGQWIDPVQLSMIFAQKRDGKDNE